MVEIFNIRNNPSTERFADSAEFLLLDKYAEVKVD